MKFNKLKIKQAGIYLLVACGVSLASCSDDNKTENNSTAGIDNTAKNPEPAMKDTSVATTGRTQSMEGKKRGIISITPVTVAKPAKMKTDDKGFYNYTETAPAFPGGHNSLENYITSKIQYPDEAIENEVEGTVYVMFTIDENGKIENAKTAGTKLGYGLEEESLRVVGTMPNWTPGTTKGKKVRAWYTIPITYKLES